MSRKEKLLNRLRQRPRDFTWEELTSLLKTLGYRIVKSGRSGGSRKRFTHETAPTIVLHKPHPHNTVKRYIINDLIEILEREGIL